VKAVKLLEQFPSPKRVPNVSGQSDREAFLKKQPSASLEQLDSQQGQNMTQNGQSFVLGICQNKLILSVSLLSN
jgi:hypothetical protein